MAIASAWNSIRLRHSFFSSAAVMVGSLRLGCWSVPRRSKGDGQGQDGDDGQDVDGDDVQHWILRLGVGLLVSGC